MSTAIQIISKVLKKDKDLPKALAEYLKTGDESLPRSIILSSDEWEYGNLAKALIDQATADPELLKVLEFLMQVAIAHPNRDRYLKPLERLFDTFLSEDTPSHHPLASPVLELISSNLEELAPFFFHFINRAYTYQWDFTLTEKPGSESPFKNQFLNLIWQQIQDRHATNPDIFVSNPDFLAAVAMFRPDLLRIFLSSLPKLQSWEIPRSWKIIVDNTTEFDSDCLAYCRQLEKKKAAHAFQILFALNEARDDAHLAQLIEYSKNPHALLDPNAIGIGLEHYQPRILSHCLETVRSIKSPWLGIDYSSPEYRKLFDLVFQSWDSEGRDLFTHLVKGMANHHFVSQLSYRKIPIQSIAFPTLREIVLKKAEQSKGATLHELWAAALEGYPSIFQQDLWVLFSSKSKNIRNLAISHLASADHPSIKKEATELLKARKAENRLGAIELLKHLGEASIPALKAAHAPEKSQKVQTEIEAALAYLGETIVVEKEELSTADLLAQIESDKRIKLPTAPWFDLSKFPLIEKDGTPLSEKVITFLIQKQSKHKTIDAAPGILPVLELLDREKNANSALALLNQWLDSGQETKDRWALVLAGLLGDNRIIPALTPRIQPWCENARHKLAEYAAQAISLLATEEALMILDTLANRYRSKFKNIGKACNAAFLAAAEARGVTPDELGDLVVPSLGFNSECHKEFDDGKIIAVLQPDFKITWLNPETEKETKSPPSNLSDAGKEELKTLRKILREAVKGQTAHLEQMLVRQRRWPVARWQELFEEHPLLQSYAANLVWGIYDPKNKLLRTFRRYPNGILAHGSGEMEDLEERDTQIGLVHPLELDNETLAIWRDHLGRFKVKPPFLQLERPVEVLEKDHSNRREITFTEDIQISGGTFLSRMNKRGWLRGSVIDAGGVTSYYKPFESAGVEAILFLEEYWVGFDPVDSFPLGKALFATLSTVDRGSYIYDDPQPTDPRVLPFGKVPLIVYSEVIADLKALIEGQSQP